MTVWTEVVTAKQHQARISSETKQHTCFTLQLHPQPLTLHLITCPPLPRATLNVAISASNASCAAPTASPPARCSWCWTHDMGSG